MAARSDGPLRRRGRRSWVIRNSARTRSSSVATGEQGPARPTAGPRPGPPAARRPGPPGAAGTRRRRCRRRSLHRSRRPRRRSSRRRGARTRAGPPPGSATTSWRRASCPSRLCQPGAPRKSETITTSDRRRRIPSAARSTTARSVVPGWRSGAGRSSRARMRSTWLRPDAGGIVSRTRESKNSAPTRLPPRDSSCATVAATSVDDDVLVPLDGPEVHRRGGVEQQPRGDLAVLDVLPDVRRVGARGDVPVDVPQVVAELVLPQVRDVDAGAAEHRPEIALQAPVQAAQHPPLEAAQHAFRA